MLAEQGGGCAICGSAVWLVVDHDHACCAGPSSCGACVRGILCGECNTIIGRVNDDADRLERAAAYLRGTLLTQDARQRKL